jgi:patatin-related protein
MESEAVESALQQDDSDDFEDVRLAVVLNGGVSLAVWMGGVTLEISQLIAKPLPVAEVYRALLSELKSTARVDVISGTSAGGINGAFLSLVPVFGVSLEPLRNVWAREADFAELLRSPTEKNPTSLLKGDALFLPRLKDAFDAVLPEGTRERRRPAGESPINLTITTTDIVGQPFVFVDDLGSPIVEVNHRAQFKLVCDGFTSPADDPFLNPHLASQLALAARSSASFPFAFEPSLVPIGNSPDPFHPDMARLTQVRTSRFMMDGGILLNQPIRPALEAIQSMPASRQVRRVLAYVNPDPRTRIATPTAANPEGVPRLSEALMQSLVSLPAAQSIQAELEEIQRHNALARDAKAARLDLVSDLGEDLLWLATPLFIAYQAIRERSAIGRIVEVVMSSRSPESSVGIIGAEPIPEWTREELAAALSQATFDLLPTSMPNLGQPFELRSWGISPVERLGDLVLDVFRRALGATPLTERALRSAIRERRVQLHTFLRTVREARIADRHFWRTEARESMPTPPEESSQRPAVLDAWVDEALVAWPSPRRRAGSPQEGGRQPTREELVIGLEQVAYNMLSLLVEACPQLRAIAALARESELPEGRKAGVWLSRVVDLTVGARRVSAPLRDAMPRLMRLEVCQLALLGGSQASEQEVDLVQISGNSESSFMRPLRAEQKLAGAKLAHFGAFHRESWRLSDWTWGRIDGSTKLCLALLSPWRLRQLGMTTDDAVDMVEQIAVIAAPPADQAYLGSQLSLEECREELRYLSDLTWPVPPGLPRCAMALARRRHLEILREELRTLYPVVASESGEGGGGHGRNRFIAMLSPSPEAADAKTVFSSFEALALGDETVGDDYGTDRLMSSLSQTAAVSLSAVTGEIARVNIAPLKAVAATLRGVSLLLYLLVRGATGGKRAGANAVSLILAIGGACLALAILSTDTPPLVATVGVVTLIAGIALAALRARLRALALALVLIVAAGIAAFVWSERKLGPGWKIIFAIVGLVVAMTILGWAGTKAGIVASQFRKWVDRARAKISGGTP